ncbi:MAG TPA: UDP-N-acetylmuramate dehydrogenase, partial [Candidatus Limiplasma sp.]|nr:UDP-N-acetylmuramate dehydrogenase [Candidatus Limiplasma sp.]
FAMEEAVRTELLDALHPFVKKKDLQEKAPMSRYTTLGFGGPAELLCEISSLDQLIAVLRIASRLRVPVNVLGNGSNLLVRDGGWQGLTLRISEHFAEVTGPDALADGRFALTAQAGAPLIKLANLAADAGLSGLEFAAGIPGTVGGGVAMNAGAYGGEMKDVVKSVTCVDLTGTLQHYTNEQMAFGYRHSRLRGTDAAPELVVSATFALPPGDPETIRVTMREFNARRREKQPLTLPCCGSTFKRPPGRFAGTLIDECGLKGLRVGGASVSTRHAGFLVNDQEGTASDYLALIDEVQRIVLEKTGVRLEPEVHIVGEDPPVSNE